MNIAEQALLLPIEIQKEETDMKLRSLIIKRWLRTDEVALYLGTTASGIKNMVYRGQLKPKKYCGRNYFSRNEIDELIGTSNKKEGRQQWR